MCGIAGIYAYREAAAPVDAAELLRVRESMRRRGPDGEGLWRQEAGRAALAHRRLAIIDLSAAAAQPMASADGRYRIAFNGEIYNYRELKRELEAQGRRFATDSDTEVLLQLYAAQGAAMLSRLRGMYAFAVWDEQEKRLFLARDPFGIKPLYYADAGGTLRFASQVKALLAGGGFKATPDAAGWAGFYIWGAVPEPLTTCEQVKALPAGAWLALEAGQAPVIGFHYSLADEIGRAASAGNSAAPDAGDLRHALEDSVQAHLVADVPVGLFLSAGVDSAVVARLAARANEGKGAGLRSITLGFEEFRGSDRDETGEAQALAAELGTQHSTRWIGRAEFDAVREEFLAAMDQPSIDGLNTYLVSRVAAEAGMKVALSGLGGDEFFGGYPSFRQVPALARALAWSAHMPALGKLFRAATAAAFRGGGAPKAAGLLEYGASIAGAYLLRRAVYMPWELERVMGADAAAEGLRRLGAGATPESAPAPATNSWAQVCALEACRYMRNMLLRDADWAGMAHGLEIRVPLVDRGVFRCVAGGISAGRPYTKQDLRAIADPRAGADSPARKRGFAVPMRSWLGGGRDAGGGEGSRRWALQVAGELGAGTLGGAR